jgi:uncharacterized lipoprotein YddW (UPF0748 family)
MTFNFYCRNAATASALLVLWGVLACTPAGQVNPPVVQPPPAVQPPPEPVPAPVPVLPQVYRGAAPQAAREFRGLWVASVGNMDWPSRAGLSPEEQRAELLMILDRAAALNLNAVILQVRPAADALYASALEPWSEYLTGASGVAPSPFYDPLEFAVREAHKRGLELHAWFNPYRARYSSTRGPAALSHVTRARPEQVRRYGPFQWLDPGDAKVRRHTIAVITDVVRRYDIDGVHIDDYFYPYREYDSRGRLIAFPDDVSWNRYRERGGKLSRDDWRRENVNVFVQELYGAVKAEKRWVKLGISPFGIWRPGYPARVVGLDSYVEIFADSRKWLQRGWLDYFAPQLYWTVDAEQQNYAELLHWWVAQNAYERHIWPGNYTGKVAWSGSKAWTAEEILRQVRATRAVPGATGNVHFGAITLVQNVGGVGNGLRADLYRQQALVPASPWLGMMAPEAPRAQMFRSPTGGSGIVLHMGQGEPSSLFIVRTRTAAGWQLEILPAVQAMVAVATGADSVLVSGVSRTGVEGPATTVRLPS